MKTTGRSGLAATTSRGRRLDIPRFAGLVAGILLLPRSAPPRPPKHEASRLATPEPRKAWRLVQSKAWSRSRRPSPLDVRVSHLLRPGYRLASAGRSARSHRRRAAKRRHLSRGRFDALRDAERTANRARAASRSATSGSCRTFSRSSSAATVDFPNEDDVYHNVFSLSSAAAPGGRGSTSAAIPKGVVEIVDVRAAGNSFRCSATFTRT